MRRLLGLIALLALAIASGCHHFTCDTCNGCGGCMDTGNGVYHVPYAQPGLKPVDSGVELIKPAPTPK
jgi:hypothetical protein